MGTRRQAREHCLQILYAVEYSGGRLRDVLDDYWVGSDEKSKDVIEFAEKLAEGALRNKKEIDGLIENASTNWKVTRMACVDRNLLRQAIFELMYLDDVPKTVTINEAVEVAKRFGTEESSKFINGVLDNVATRLKKG